MSSNTIKPNVGAYVGNLGIPRFIPEPQSRVVNGFSKILGGVASLVTGGGGTGLDAQAEFSDILSKQIEVQTQMQVVSMESNIEKSKHETLMSPVRNIRTS